MYPFERFTARAKKVLTLAQGEPERSHHSYIGTEHMLLALLIEGEGIAALVLIDLGVTIDKVRAEIERLQHDPALRALEEAPRRPTHVSPPSLNLAAETAQLMQLAMELAQ